MLFGNGPDVMYYANVHFVGVMTQTTSAVRVLQGKHYVSCSFEGYLVHFMFYMYDVNSGYNDHYGTLKGVFTLNGVRCKSTHY